MALFFDEMTIPSTSQSTPKTGHEESQMTVETDRDSSFGKFSTVTTSDTGERHTSSSIDDISRRVQKLVENINEGRTSDQKVLDSFHEDLVEKVTEACQQMKEHMYMVYKENSHEMQVKLHELNEVLESCSKLCNELLEANQALAGLREGLAVTLTESP